MIQHYRELIATVTYDEKSSWLKNNNIINDRFEIDYGVNDIKIRDKYSLGTQEEYFYRMEYDQLNSEQRFYENFNILSEALNKPIDHIVHEMKNVQQPDISNKYIQQEEIQKRLKTAKQYLIQHKLSDENKEMSLSVAKDIAVMHLEDLLARYEYLDATYIEEVENFLALYYACEKLKEKQHPDNIERLKAITNEQWKKFAEKYNLEFDIDVNDQFSIAKNGKYINHKLHAQFFPVRRDDIKQRRRVLDALLFFKNILAESISEFEYAQNIHDLITELEAM